MIENNKTKYSTEEYLKTPKNNKRIPISWNPSVTKNSIKINQSILLLL